MNTRNQRHGAGPQCYHCISWRAAAAGRVRIAFRDAEWSPAVEPGAEQVRLDNVRLNPGAGTFEASLTVDAETVGAWHVDVVLRQSDSPPIPVSNARRTARE